MKGTGDGCYHQKKEDLLRADQVVHPRQMGFHLEGHPVLLPQTVSLRVAHLVLLQQMVNLDVLDHRPWQTEETQLCSAHLLERVACHLLLRAIRPLVWAQHLRWLFRPVMHSDLPWIKTCAVVLVEKTWACVHLPVERDYNQCLDRHHPYQAAPHRG